MLVLNLGDVKMYPKEDGELKGNYLFGANSLFFFFLNVLLLCYSFCTEERRNDTSELFKSVMKRDTLSDLTHLLSSYCVICPFRL